MRSKQNEVRFDALDFFEPHEFGGRLERIDRRAELDQVLVVLRAKDRTTMFFQYVLHAARRGETNGQSIGREEADASRTKDGRNPFDLS